MPKRLQIPLMIALLLPPAIALMIFFGRFDIEGTSLAIDWKLLYPAIEGGVLRYEGTGLRQAPWSILPLLPLGLFGQGAGWGLLTYIMLLVLLLSVPRVRRRGLYITALLLTLLSYPAIRTIADGNFEILGTAGVLLIVFGYRVQSPWAVAGGVLLASSKPQVGVLVVLVAGLYMLRTWPPRQWLTAAGAVLGVVIPTMLIWGPLWIDSMVEIPERGSIVDSNLLAALQRTGFVPDAVGWVLWGALLAASLWIAYRVRFRLSRELAGMLVAAGLLIAPYAAGNSMLTVYVVGVIPLFLRRRLLGAVLIVLTNLLYLALGQTTLLFNYSAYYWTFVWLVSWGVLAWDVWAQHREATSLPGAQVTQQPGYSGTTS